MPSADTIIDVRSLIDRPGATRSLDRLVPAPGDLPDELTRLTGPVSIRARIDSVVDGLLVGGTVAAPVRLACSRCLAEWNDTVRSDITELFTAGDAGATDDVEVGYDIVDATIDLDVMIRDALAGAMPVRPLCTTDCAGLCPTCGTDLNQRGCDGHPARPDQRWAALADLKFPDAR